MHDHHLKSNLYANERTNERVVVRDVDIVTNHAIGLD